MADLTMDRRCTWTRRCKTFIHSDSANLIIQTDGGLREGDCAAASFIIGLWGKRDIDDDDSEYFYEPLVAHCTFLELPMAVFGTEAIALDEASQEAAALIAT